MPPLCQGLTLFARYKKLAAAAEMRYDTLMKYVMTLMLMLALLLPCQAGQREDALLGGLLGLGARALEQQAARAEPAAAAAPSAAQAARQAASVAAPGSLSLMVKSSVRPVVDELIAEYKEQYKEEGRVYTRELADVFVERVMHSPRVQEALGAVILVGGCVVGYLTLVTLIMLLLLLHLKRANARLMAEVKKLARR